MNMGSLRTYLAAPFASLFGILAVCACVVHWPVPVGVSIPMMRLRHEPLTNCEFNGFTYYIRGDGSLTSGWRDGPASRNELLSRVHEARDNVQDDTFYVIADPDSRFGDVAPLLAEIQQNAAPNHVALVTRMGQVEGISLDEEESQHRFMADRCRFEWPALPRQRGWHPAPRPPLAKLTMWEALKGQVSKH